MFIYRFMFKYVVRKGKREVFGLVGGALMVDVVIARYHLYGGSILWLPSPVL